MPNDFVQSINIGYFAASFLVLTLIDLMKDLHHMHLNLLVLLEKENAQAIDFPRLKLTSSSYSLSNNLR